MQIPSSLSNITARVLAESLDVQSMSKIADLLIPNYDIYERSGFPANIPIQKQDASRQIVRDVIRCNSYLDLVTILIRFHTEGYMGKKYPIKGLKALLKELNDMGLVFDQVNKMFVEDAAKRKTRNWGVLSEGREYILAFLSIDVVGNTRLVKQYSPELIKKTYAHLREIVQKAIDKRNGRIWSWEGDGGMIAFYFSNKYLLATLSGMEIIHELLLYNIMQNPLDKPVSVRMAIHGGPCIYTSNDEDIKEIDVVKKVMDMEARYTRPNMLTVSNIIKTSLDSQLSKHFRPLEGDMSGDFFVYQLQWEN